MAEGVVTSVRGYRDIALMWTRAAMAYPASFWMMAVSGFVIGLLDFVGIWIMFHTIDSLGGWTSRRSPSCTAPPASGSRPPTWSSAASSGSAR